MHKQRGITFIGLVFVIVVLGFVAVMSMKLMLHTHNGHKPQHNNHKNQSYKSNSALLMHSALLVDHVANSAEIIEIPPDEKCTAYNIILRNKAPVTTIFTIIAIITHGKVISRRHFFISFFGKGVIFNQYVMLFITELLFITLGVDHVQPSTNILIIFSKAHILLLAIDV